MKVITRFSGFIFLACVAAGFALMPLRTSAASNIFLSLTGITGEATNTGFTGQIIVSSFSESLTNIATRGSFSDITIVKSVDSATPVLFTDCAGATTISSAVLKCQSLLGNQPVYYTISLTGVHITSVQSGGGTGSDRPTETITLSYQQIQWTYQQLDANGNTVGSPITHSWNLSTNSGS